MDDYEILPPAPATAPMTSLGSESYNEPTAAQSTMSVVAPPATSVVAPEGENAIPQVPKLSKYEALLQYRKRKAERLTATAGLGPDDLKEDTRVVKGNYEYASANKIFNDASLEEADYIENRLYQETGAVVTPEGVMGFGENGELVPYAGDVNNLGSLYTYLTKDGNIKRGYTRNLDVAQRYNDPEQIGTLGVDIEQLLDVKIMPYQNAELLETRFHGNKYALENRVVRKDVLTSWDDYKELAAMYGSGFTEVYKPYELDPNAEFDRENVWNEFKERYRIDSGRQLTDEERADLYNEQDRQNRAKIVSQNGVGFINRAHNVGTAAAAMFASELIINPADLILEAFGSDALGDAKNKADLVNNFLGYDPSYADGAMRDIEDNVTNIYNSVSKGEGIELDDVYEIFKAAIKTPELVSSSIGGIAALFFGLGKFTKVGKAVRGVEKDLRAGKLSKAEAKAKVKEIKKDEGTLRNIQTIAADQVGYALVVSGRANETIETFQDNGGELTASSFVRIVGIETLAAGIDKLSGALATRDIPLINKLTNPDALRASREIIEEIENPALYLKVADSFIGATLTAGKVGGVGVVESGTEYLQTMATLFNEQYATEKYGSDIGLILGDKLNQIEGFTGAAVGFVTGGQMELAGAGFSRLGKGRREKAVADRAEAVVEASEPENLTTEEVLSKRKEYTDIVKSFEEKITARKDTGVLPSDIGELAVKLEYLNSIEYSMEGATTGQVEAAEKAKATIKELITAAIESSEYGDIELVNNVKASEEQADSADSQDLAAAQTTISDEEALVSELLWEVSKGSYTNYALNYDIEGNSISKATVVVQDEEGKAVQGAEVSFTEEELSHLKNILVAKDAGNVTEEVFQSQQKELIEDAFSRAVEERRTMSVEASAKDAEATRAYTEEQKAAVAQGVIRSVVEQYKGELPAGVEQKLHSFAAKNGLAPEVAEKMIKSFETVEIEATIADRGIVARKEKLRTILDSGDIKADDIQAEYDGAATFRATTAASLSALRKGIKQAKVRAATENNKTGNRRTKDIKITTEYMTHPESTSKGAPFVITVKRTPDGWVAEVKNAENLVAKKVSNLKGLDGLLNIFHQEAMQYIDPDTTLDSGGYTITKTSGETKKGTADEISYVARVKEALKGKKISKVILGDGKAEYWGPTKMRTRTNSTITNVSTTQGGVYTAEDVVYLHATGSITLGNGVKVSELYAIDSSQNKEISAAVEAGATIVMSTANKVTNGKPRAVKGKKEKALSPGAMNAAYMKSVGYIPYGINQVEKNIFVPDNEANALNLAVKKEEGKAAAAAEKEKGKAEDKVRKLAIELRSKGFVGPLVGEGRQEVSAAQDLENPSRPMSQVLEEFDRAVEDIRGNFSERALDQAVKSVRSRQDDATSAENSEAVDTTKETTATDESIDFEQVNKDAEDISFEELSDGDKALVEILVTENEDTNLSSFADRLVKNSVKEAKTTLKGAGKNPVEFTDKHLEKLVKESIEADEKAGEEGTSFLAAWKNAKAERLDGNSLLGAINDVLKAFGKSVTYSKDKVTDGVIQLGGIASDILNNSIGAKIGASTYYVSIKKTITDKKTGTVRYEYENKINYDKTTRNRKNQVVPVVVGKPFYYGKTAHVNEVLSVTKVTHNPAEYLTSTGSTPLSTIAVDTLPQVFKDITAVTLSSMKKVIKPLSAVEKDFKKPDDGTNRKDQLSTIDSPARTLVFDKDGNIHESMATAFAIAIRDLVASDKRKLMVGPKDPKVIAAMFGIPETQLTQAHIDFAKDNGSYAKSVNNTLGKSVLQGLGIKLDKSSAVGIAQYERMVTDIGNMVLRVAEDQGILEVKEVLSNQVAQLIKDGEVLAGDKSGTYTNFVTVPHVSEMDPDIGARRNVPAKSAAQAIVEQEEIEAFMPDIMSNKKEAYFGKPPSKEKQDKAVSTIRNDKVGGKVPKDAKKALKGYMNTEYAINVKEVEKMLERLDNDDTRADMLRILGYVEISEDNPVYKGMLYNKKIIQESINEDILRSIEHLREATDRIRKGKVENSLYFGFYYSSNHRYNLDSNTLNPQNDKLHRFFIQPKAHKVSYTVDSKDNSFIYHYEKDGERETIDSSLYVRAALAQAIGVGIDKTYTSEIIKVGNQLLAMSSKDVETMTENYLSTGTVSIQVNGEAKTIKPDHPSHALQALQFLEDFAASKAKGDSSFEFTSSLSAEFDALTSGFSNKVQQYGTLADLNSHATRVGIIRSDLNNNDRHILKEGMGINDMLADPTRLDSYKNLADITIRAVGVLSESMDFAPNKDMFKALQGVLPGGSSVGKANFVIDGALRNLFKPAFMIFNYSAGISRIVKNLSEEMIESSLAEIASADLRDPKNAHILAAAEAISEILPGMSPATLQMKLRTEAVYSLKVDVVTVDGKVRKSSSSDSKGSKDKKALVEYLAETIIVPTYGEAVKSAFETEFKDFIEIQNTTNDMFKQSYEVFNRLLLKKIQKTKASGVDTITEDMLKSMIDELRPAFPVIAGPLSTMLEGGTDNLADGVHIYDVSTRSPKGVLKQVPSPQTKIKDKDNKEIVGRTSNPLVKSIVAAANAGAVLPFHALDGAQQASMSNEFVETWVRGRDLEGKGQTFSDDADSVGSGILPIHDAHIGPLPFSDILGYSYNKNTVDINKRYSIMAEIVKMAKRAESIITDKDSELYLDPSKLAAVDSLSVWSDKDLKEQRTAAKNARAATDKLVKSKKSYAKTAEDLKAESDSESATKKLEEAVSFKTIFNKTMETLIKLNGKVEEGRKKVLEKGTAVGVMVAFKGSIYTVPGKDSSEDTGPDLSYLEQYKHLYNNVRVEPAPVAPKESKKGKRNKIVVTSEVYAERAAYASRVIGEADALSMDKDYTEFVNANLSDAEYTGGEVVLVVFPTDSSIANSPDGFQALNEAYASVSREARKALSAGAVLLFNTADNLVGDVTPEADFYNGFIGESGLRPKPMMINGSEYVVLSEKGNPTFTSAAETSSQTSGNDANIDIIGGLDLNAMSDGPNTSNVVDETLANKAKCEE